MTLALIVIAYHGGDALVWLLDNRHSTWSRVVAGLLIVMYVVYRMNRRRQRGAIEGLRPFDKYPQPKPRRKPRR